MGDVRLVAGVDCSTQSTKVVIVDVTSGAVVATGRHEHEVHYAEGSVAETDPRVWWEALRSALAQTGRAADIDAIAVGGQQHGLVIVDADGEPVRPAMLWCDLRASVESDRIISELGGAAQAAGLAGSLPIASFTAPKWAWVRAHEPEVAARAAGLRLPHDWINERLTGEATTDRGEASGSAWWSPVTGRYEPGLLTLPSLGLDESLLPRVVEPHEVAGHVSERAAAELGLRVGIPVAPGTGDNAAAALGLGLSEGQPVISLGTSATAYTRSVTSTVDPTGAICGFADATGDYLPLVCVQNCTLAVETMATMLGLDRQDAAEHTDVVVLPFYGGERTPYVPNAQASVLGMRATTTSSEVLLATYQGVAAMILRGLGMLELRDGAPLVLIGGGSRGHVWERVIRDLSGRELVIPDEKELVAMGAAVQAAGVATGEPFEAISERWGGLRGRRVEAAEHDVATYERILAIEERMRGFNGEPL
jgi:xylulokinase